MKYRLTTALFLFTISGWAGDRELIEEGESVILTPTGAVTTEPDKGALGWGCLLDRISIVPSEGSSPASYIVAGRAVSANTGSPFERVPIYVGREGFEPQLAALTNVDGEFKFRLWVKEDHRVIDIQVPEDLSGFLYVRGELERITSAPPFQSLPQPPCSLGDTV